jgi:hypothetical protein
VLLNEPSLHRRSGQTREIDADQEMPLLWALRDLLGLTGTQLGCGEALRRLHGAPRRRRSSLVQATARPGRS